MKLIIQSLLDRVRTLATHYDTTCSFIFTENWWLLEVFEFIKETYNEWFAHIDGDINGHEKNEIASSWVVIKFFRKTKVSLYLGWVSHRERTQLRDLTRKKWSNRSNCCCVWTVKISGIIKVAKLIKQILRKKWNNDDEGYVIRMIANLKEIRPDFGPGREVEWVKRFFAIFRV